MCDIEIEFMVDIEKGSDSLDHNFLLSALKKFGFRLLDENTIK